MDSIAIVIPTLNEEGSIGEVVDQISLALNRYKYEVLIVEGYSSDNTAKIATDHGATVIFQRSMGYGDALLTGFLHVKDHSDADIIVMIDADLTYDPEDIPRLIKPILEDNVDLVVGNRFNGSQIGTMPLLNRFGNKTLSWIARRALKIDVHDTQCGLRAFKSKFVENMDLVNEGMPFATEMLAEFKYTGARITEVPVNYRSRIGKTKLNPIRDGLMIFSTILRLARDTQPLLFFGGIGGLLGLIGFIFGIDVTLEWFRTGTVGKIPTVILSVLFIIGGIQFFTLGLIADMIKKRRDVNDNVRL